MKQGIHLIITIILFTLVVEARPSWCSKARSQVEHRICDNSELSVLDDKITKLYRNVRKGVSGASKKRLVSAQRKWIKNRNSNCKHSDDSCIKEYYVSRIQALGGNSSTQTATVTGLDPNGDGFLSLRNKPKQREIGKLYNGDKVEILSQSGKYYKVKDVKSGMIGYAHSNWIRKISNSTTASTSTSQKKGTVHGLDPNGDGFLSIRSKPKGKKIGELYNGDKVAILGQRGAWYKVRTSSGLVGWSHGNWVSVKDTTSLATANHNNEADTAHVKSKWITPSNKVCRANGGYLYKGICKAKLSNAKSVCRASGGRLPTKSELVKVIDDCGGKTANTDSALLENMRDSNYQACYKRKGFSASNNYWSTTPDNMFGQYEWYVNFDDGSQGRDYSTYGGYVRCVRAGL